jgi:hypothetical protein
MKKILSLLVLAVVLAPLGQAMSVSATPMQQPSQQSTSNPETNYLSACHLLNRTDPMRDYYGNVTECHEDRLHLRVED